MTVPQHPPELWTGNRSKVSAPYCLKCHPPDRLSRLSDKVTAQTRERGKVIAGTSARGNEEGRSAEPRLKGCFQCVLANKAVPSIKGGWMPVASSQTGHKLLMLDMFMKDLSDRSPQGCMDREGTILYVHVEGKLPPFESLFRSTIGKK